MNSKYHERCLRSLGITTEATLEKIRSTAVAVAGMGLGGSVFIDLVRMGFEKFHVADPDVYERTNINRQRAAKETTIGSRKDDCLIQEALAINPELQIKRFRDGVTPENVEEFLKGIDWVVDAVDVFAIPDKLALHEASRKKGIPVVSCVSVGFGASIVTFDSSTPAFAELTGMKVDAPYEKNIERFAKFLAPEMPDYMADQVVKALRKESHIPFVVSGVEISAALVTTEISKHLLGIGDRVMAPQGLYIDPVNVRFEKFEANYRAKRASPLKKVA